MVQKLTGVEGRRKVDLSLSLTSVKILNNNSYCFENHVGGGKTDRNVVGHSHSVNIMSGGGSEGDKNGNVGVGGVEVDPPPPLPPTTSLPPLRPIAIRVRKADKCYGRKEPPVMKGLDMTVREGTIYTLLGSSGCGKTTLLNCIIGVQKADAGEILVFGKQPCTKGSGVPGQLVGYMPQDISLYPTLTIAELLEYFGRLYGMTKAEIVERCLFLVKFLQLPNQSQIVGSLSGGQQRRTSFAVSLISDPPLLILDEPTVGTDPLLRESIWDHLVDLVSRKRTTVLITTHYMEESRKSHMVGFMRNGRLLVEQSPQSLMDQHAETLITPIILKLCRNDTSTAPMHTPTFTSKQSSSYPPSQAQLQNVTIVSNLTTSPSEVLATTALPQPSVCGSIRLARNHLFAMIKKNSLLMTRNYIILLFLICVPAIQATLFCLAVGEDPKDLPFGVVNHETNMSTPCSPSTYNYSNPECNMDLLSCRFLAKIPTNQITLEYYSNKEAAHSDLMLGKIWGYMQIPSNFSQYLFMRSMMNSGQYTTSNETFLGSQITLEVDASSKQITSTYYTAFASAFQNFSRDLLESCGVDKRAADFPLTYMDPAFGNFGSSFRDFLAPSLVLGILFFFPMISSAMQNIRERKQGTYQRSFVAGIKTWETLAAYSVTESIIVIFQTAVGFFIVSCLFQIDIKGSVALVFSLCVVVGLCGVSVGFLIGAFCKEETDAALLSMGIFFPNFMLSGMFWPIEGLPVVLRYVSYGLPCTLASEAIRSIINRGWKFTHPKVWPGFAVAGGWIVVYWALNVIIQRVKAARKKRCCCC